MTAQEWWLFTRLADKACRAVLKESESYKVFRKAQAIAQQRRTALFLVNHRRRMEKDEKEKVA
jgi:phosphotransacetylase